MIEVGLFSFLSELQQNNNREWFDDHKKEYTQHRKNIEQWMLSLQSGLSKFDRIEGFHLFRIYRDVRFSKDKTPYKTNISGYFTREGAERRGSYYFSIEPNAVFIGGGFYGPNKDDLFRIRKELEINAQELRNIITAPHFQQIYGELQGERLKTAPRGFDKEHPDNDLIAMKHFYAMKSYSPKEAQANNFSQKVVSDFETLLPFFDFMTEVLTTNLNGEKII